MNYLAEESCFIRDSAPNTPPGMATWSQKCCQEYDTLTGQIFTGLAPNWSQKGKFEVIPKILVAGEFGLGNG